MRASSAKALAVTWQKYAAQSHVFMRAYMAEGDLAQAITWQLIGAEDALSAAHFLAIVLASNSESESDPYGVYEERRRNP